VRFALLAIFFTTILLALGSYAFYPLIIWIFGKVAPFKFVKKDSLPYVSIIIPAYNEAKSIKAKMENTLLLEYPKDRFEVLVGSDGSTDRTGEIVRDFATRGVGLFEYGKNRGKTAVQNDLVRNARGEILIFTDAASLIGRHAVSKLVRNFADERIGCVAGRMHFINTDANITTQSQGFYWRYEAKIRELESRLGSLVGVDGPLYAVRRDCYVPLGENIISDLVTPLVVLEQGRKVVLEREAIVNETPTQKAKQEFATRRRITLRGLVGISSYLRAYKPVKHPMMLFQIFGHKIIRWFVGLLAIVNIVACSMLSMYWNFRYILLIYGLFFLMGAIGCIADRMGVKIKMFAIPYYFIIVNLAATVGIVDYFRKRNMTSWEPVR
jgi:cellulose synthase/poly-beta-1,6-N-acetylglucosamine synthase-like glycosyltransferase